MDETIAILLTASTVAASCALVGCFLVLRRTLLVADAVSHSVLPGIVLAFALAGGSRAPVAMLLGAAFFGLLTVALVERLAQSKQLHEDAAIGVVFSGLFAIGVLGVSYYESVDLDLDCVLFGNIEFVPFDVLFWAGREWGPRPLWLNGAALLLNLLLIALFYKELKVSTFDPEFAQALGLRPGLLHYLLMGAVSFSCVAAFESVGAILVLALLAVPAATAYLLCRRLCSMLLVAAVLAILTAWLGYPAAFLINASIAGATAVVAGVFFALALVFAPERGLLSQLLLRRRLTDRLKALFVLAHLPTTGEPVTVDQLAARLACPRRSLQRALSILMREGFVEQQNGRLRAVPRAAETLEELPRDLPS
jgi:manganese/zinc/iron transport system permease protein